MKRICLLVLPALVLACAGLAFGAEPKTGLAQRLVYIQTNLLVDKNVEAVLQVLQHAAKAGYNGVVIADSKFMRWDNLPSKYLANVRKVRQACTDLKLALLPCVMPIGYSNDLLGRDPNLAEGLPVKDAPFVSRDGRLVPESDPETRLLNGGFEDHKGDMPTGWAFADQTGKITFSDREVVYEGKASLRMEDIGRHDPQYGHGRIMQKLRVRPFRYYHLSVMVKTQDFAGEGEIRATALGTGGVMLSYHMPPIAKTQDWKRIDVTFNTLEFSEVALYLGIWGPRNGKIWWDDVRLEPAGLVNAVRRDGAPLRVTSEDGKTTYVEGKDFDNAKDPLLGNDPYPGSFSAWHKEPVITVPAGRSLKEGQRVLLSYYETPIIYNDQVMCCMCEPKVYDICRWQIEQVKAAMEPDGYFMSHDEMRVQGWDESCVKSGKRPGQILADNVARCAEIIRQIAPGKPIHVWSDMFDPFHNARKTGRYYLVKGDGPWYDSWKGLPKDVIVENWNSNPKERMESLKHFDAPGNAQVLAGYYDADPSRITGWLQDAAGIRGLAGVMYTTWRHQYSDLEKFAEICWGRQ